jgi:hypothetical protein
MSRVWHSLLGLVLTVSLLLCGCSGKKDSGPPSGPSGDKPEDRQEAKGEEEELVKKHVLATHENPSSVKFLRWGPHVLKKELDALKDAGKLRDKGDDNYVQHLLKIDARVRVKYSDKDKEGKEQPPNDTVYAIIGKTVETDEEGYDEWKADFLKELTRRFPGIKP